VATSSSTPNPVVAAIDRLVSNGRVRLAMLVGSGLESGWDPHQVGDNGTSFGPYQMHIGGALTAAGGTPQQAQDPAWATRAMLGAYTAAVARVPDRLWNSDPKNAAALAAYYAERPARMYEQGRIDSVWRQVGAGISAASTAVAEVARAIAYSRAQIGKPYQWGEEGPAAFDCSGLMQTAFKQAGVELPRTARAQYAATSPVSVPAAGDLVFFGRSAATIHHVGLYIGGGKMIDAPTAGHPVGIHQVDSYGDYFGATRVVAGGSGGGTAGDAAAGGTQGFGGNPLSAVDPAKWAAEGKKLVLIGLFVGTGLLLVLAGAWRGVAPTVAKTAGQVGGIAGVAGAAA
jgi:cell wall-associated NlpC family hydrolase